jgi:phage portal protein BeeE
MGFWRDIFGPEVPEQRMITSLAGIERPGANLLQVYGLGDVTLPAVTIESALTVPAVWAAVSFLSRTLAALPLHAFRKAGDGPEKIAGGLETLIHEAPNPEWTSFKLRQHFWQQVFTGGRGLLYIERSGSNIVGLWPIDPSNVQIKRSTTGQTTYHVGGKVYSAANVIDISFMLRADGLGHYGPIAQGALAIQLALAMNSYGSSFFAGGGIPPLALTGPLPAGPEAMRRALADVQRAIDAARESGKQVEEIARIYNLPPVFLQDLTRATFTNAEQQDLHLVKHLIGQWAEALEEEMNLKLFGQRNGGRYVEHNLDGLLRGDYATRMEGHSKAIQNAIRTPDEVRALENLPSKPNGDKLMIQGATVPLGTEPKEPEPQAPPTDEGNNEDGA